MILSDAISRGVFASRPAAGSAGRLYYATDTGVIYRDNGSTWDVFGGSAKSHTVLHDSTLGSPGRFDVTSISGGHQHLEIILSGRSSVSAIGDSVYVYANNDTTATNYNCQNNTSLGTSITTEAVALPKCFIVPGATSPASSFGYCRMFIPLYAGTGTLKVAQHESAHSRDTNVPIHGSGTWWWESTAAITRLTIQPDGYATDNFATGTRLQIIGVNHV